jgi:hypothetical protein
MLERSQGSSRREWLECLWYREWMVISAAQGERGRERRHEGVRR